MICATFYKSFSCNFNSSNGLNPFIFTDYEGFDPEWAWANVGDGSNGVSSRTYQFGVNLKF